MYTNPNHQIVIKLMILARLFKIKPNDAAYAAVASKGEKRRVRGKEKQERKGNDNSKEQRASPVWNRAAVPRWHARYPELAPKDDDDDDEDDDNLASSSLASSKGGLENSTKQRIDLVTEQLAGDRSNQKSGGSPLCRGNEAGSLCRHDEEGTSRVDGCRGGWIRRIRRRNLGAGIQGWRRSWRKRKELCEEKNKRERERGGGAGREQHWRRLENGLV